MVDEISPRPEDRYVTCVPFVILKMAAGTFGDAQYVENETGNGWESQRRVIWPGMFVSQVVGRSMESQIPDGSYCLFTAPVEGPRQGKIVLVQLRDSVEPETGERYTVKRYESKKISDGNSWAHSKITLKPLNPAFDPIVLTEEVEGQVTVIAECVEVLSSGY